MWCVCVLVVGSRTQGAGHGVDSLGHVGREPLFSPLFHCIISDWIRARGVSEARSKFGPCSMSHSWAVFVLRWGTSPARPRHLHKY